MKRHVLRIGAIIGAAAVSTLAVSPVFAAAATSQATAQSLNIGIAGNKAVSQIVTATNDGTGQAHTNSSTIPSIAGVFPGTNLLGAGVAPQDAGANNDGTSFACAGIAGTGSSGAIVNVGQSACNIDGNLLTIGLGNINLGNVILSSDSALGSALAPIIDPLNTGLLQGVIDQVVAAVDSGLAGTPLGQIGIGGSLSAIEGQCTANPDAATGTAHLVDSSGGSNVTPISVTLPNGSGGTQNLPLVNLPANPPPNTHVVTGLNTVTATLIAAIKVELGSALNGALPAALQTTLGTALDAVQTQIVDMLVANLQAPLLQPLQQNLIDITLNKQVSSNAGKKIDVTALDLQLLPAAAQVTGASLISGQIGEVTCGPNTRATVPTASPSPTPTHHPLPNVPTVVDSGMAGHQDHTARDVLAATAALMLLAGTAGLIGYRRMLNK